MDEWSLTKIIKFLVDMLNCAQWVRIFIFIFKFLDRSYYAFSVGHQKSLQWVTHDVKGTNGRQKTYEISHVYSIFYSGFMCQTTVIFGITKRWKSVLNTLASWNCFTCRNLFQNVANDMSECLTFETAFCKKSSKFCIVRIIRFWSNFASLW